MKSGRSVLGPHRRCAWHGVRSGVWLYDRYSLRWLHGLSSLALDLAREMRQERHLVQEQETCCARGARTSPTLLPADKNMVLCFLLLLLDAYNHRGKQGRQSSKYKEDDANKRTKDYLLLLTPALYLQMLTPRLQWEYVN